jgi:hypothetical protein
MVCLVKPVRVTADMMTRLCAETGVRWRFVGDHLAAAKADR